MATNSQLFSEFAPTSKKEWVEKATADLKGADFDKKLVWKTDEGFSVQPFYTSEDLENIDISAFRLSGSERKWSNYVSIDATDFDKANKLAVKLIPFDIHGIIFQIEDAHNLDFKALLKGIDPTRLQISFKLINPSASFIKAYFDYLTSNNIDLNKIAGFVDSDILESWTINGTDPDFKALAAQVNATSLAKNFKGLTISSHAFVDAGSGIVQELGFTLNKVADAFELLNRLGISYEVLASQLQFHLAIGGDYFFEIAKLRAFKVLAKEILSCYGVKNPTVSIFSSSSLWSKSIFDPQVNFLRNTTEAMSSILGGTDALLINPHDNSFKEPDELSRRIALHISNILKEESYLDKVIDPSAGSYYLETITKEIAGHSNQLFQEIEKEGGFIKAFEKGIIQEKISLLKSAKVSDFSTRKRVIVGTNKYPGLNEKNVSEKKKSLSPKSSDIKLLTPQRMTKAFDDMRLRTLQQDKTPKVYLACFGNLTMRKARASFSSEFFGTAGFETMGEFFFEDVLNGAKESATSDADIVVICSSDQEYESEGVAFARAFRKLNPKKKLIIAGYPTEILDKLKEAGVDSFIHMKTNVIDFITELQNGLFSSSNN